MRVSDCIVRVELCVFNCLCLYLCVCSVSANVISSHVLGSQPILCVCVVFVCRGKNSPASVGLSSHHRQRSVMCFTCLFSSPTHGLLITCRLDQYLLCMAFSIVCQHPKPSEMLPPRTHPPGKGLFVQAAGDIGRVNLY